MRRTLKFLLGLLLVLIVIGGVMLWTLPADVAYRQGARFLGPVTLMGVRGTIWHGHADAISLFGRDLGEIDWTMPKIAFLTGHVRADVRIQGNDVDAAGTVEREGAGAMTVHDVRFRFPAEVLQPMLEVPDLHLLGTVSGVIDTAALSGGYLASADGNARWSDAGVSGANNAHFSDIVTEFKQGPNGGIVGSAHDDGQGNLAVTATWHAGIAGFEADAVLRARGDDPGMQEALSHLGAPQADGSTRVVIRGHMLKLF